MRTWLARSLAAFALLGVAAIPAIAQQLSSPRAQGEEISQAGSGPINLVVESHCQSGAAMFKISNQGDAWPRLGTLALVRVDRSSVEMISKRQMRFAEGQKASFRVKDARGETFAILIQPSWYARPHQFDGQITCE